MAADAPYLKLAGLAKRYDGGQAAVAGLDLAVARGEFVTLLGPSGCGKTTTLRMIAGLVEPSAGRIEVAGIDVTKVPAHRRNMGVVFQSYALFPHLSVARNVAFGLEMRDLPRGSIERRVTEALALVRLAELAERKPKALSGGQQQRVALARALVIEPSVLLLDEPLSNLDAKLREELRDEIRDIQRRLGITAIFVTHDQMEALTMSDRIVLMNAGRIEQVGSPAELYERPASPFVAGFIGRMNRLTAAVTASGGGRSRLDASGLSLMASRELPLGVRVTVMVRPHRIRLSARGGGAGEGNAVRARVRKLVFAGEAVQLEIDAAGLVLRVEQPTGGGGWVPGIGEEVAATWSLDDTLVFAER
ncbi:MAG TPA: ABC transporter ATP-binding protein [Stellaceae bacterium]|nr:ABC transporter ATP-binding protein [Stellaceae bacterium]